jgi:hypothetical protein
MYQGSQGGGARFWGMQRGTRRVRQDPEASEHLASGGVAKFGRPTQWEVALWGESDMAARQKYQVHQDLS